MQTNGIYDQSSALLQRNLTLAALPPEVLQELQPSLQPLELPQGFVLVKPDHPISWIYFLTHGMCSMTSVDLPGTAVEVGIIGREGIVGVQALLGPAKTQNQLVMQGAGAGYRVRADVLRDALLGRREALEPVHIFLYAMLEQTTQLILCNRLHDLDARLARWLLMTADFMQTKSLQLTQEYLAEMLGVGRPAVTIAAGQLQRSGLIAYSRGLIELLDRTMLQKRACECYSIIRAVYHFAYPTFY